MSAIEIVGLGGELGHLMMGEHGNLKCYQQGGKMQNTETEAATDDSLSRG